MNKCILSMSTKWLLFKTLFFKGKIKIRAKSDSLTLFPASQTSHFLVGR